MFYVVSKALNKKKAWLWKQPYNLLFVQHIATYPPSTPPYPYQYPAPDSYTASSIPNWYRQGFTCFITSLTTKWREKKEEKNNNLQMLENGPLNVKSRLLK